MSIFKTTAFRKNLVILIVAMVAVPALIVVYSVFRERNRELEDAKHDAIRHVGQSSQYIVQLANSSELFLTTLSRLEIVQKRDETAVNNLLVDMVSQYPQFSSFFITDESGNRWASTIKVAGAANYGDRRYFINAVSTGRFSSGEYAVGKVKARPVFSFGRPVKSASGAVCGVVAASIDLGSLNAQFEEKTHTSGLSGFILDHNGTVLYSSTNAELVGTRVRDSLFRSLKDGTESGIFETEEAGVSKFVSFKKLWLSGEAEPYMYVCTEISHDMILKRVNRAFAVNLIILLIGTSVLLLLAYKFSNRFLLKKIDENERRFRTFIENANDVTFVLTPEGVFDYVSPQWEASFGHECSKTVGSHFRDFVHPDDVPACYEFMRRTLESGEKQSGVEYRVLCQDGSYLWYNANASVVTDSSGAAPLLVGIGRNITGNKKLEETLRESDNLLTQFMAHSPVHTFIQLVTQTESRTLKCSDSFQQMIGRSASEMIGKTMEELFPPELAAKINADNWGIISNGKVLEVDEELNGRYYRTIKFPIILHGRNLLAGFTIDITERRLAEEVLREFNKTLEERILEKTATLEYRTRLLETMSETTIDGILMVDGSGRVILTNSRFAEIWNLPAEIFDELDDAKLQAAVLSQLKNPEEFVSRVAWLYEHSDQVGMDVVEFVDGRTFDRYSSPLVNSAGECFGRAWFFRDITSNRRLQEQLQQSLKLESVGRLAGGIAHDFNNKLSVIMGYAQLAREDLPDVSCIDEYLTEISRAAEFSREITSQLLAFSSQQIVSPRPVDVNGIIGKTGKSLSRLIGDDISLEFNPCQDVWTIMIDPVQVEQIIMNLAVNSRDAMPGGGVINIATANHTFAENAATDSLFPGHPDGEYVLISVSDTGSGMDDETLRHIFEPFYTTKEVGKGTGLGLATIHGIVMQNNGHIYVRSRTGEGTTFRIFFPRLEAAAEEPEPNSPVYAKCTGSILLVEDEEEIRRLIYIMLDRAGYSVTQCGSAEDAIEAFEQSSGGFDLILTDILMPGMNGKEMVNKIRLIDSSVKALYISGYSSETFCEKGVRIDYSRFIQKPVVPAILMKKIADILKT